MWVHTRLNRGHSSLSLRWRFPHPLRSFTTHFTAGNSKPVPVQGTPMLCNTKRLLPPPHPVQHLSRVYLLQTPPRTPPGAESTCGFSQVCLSSE